MGVYGLLGSGNVGNDGSLGAMLAYLRERHPDAVVDVICDGPEAVTARWGLPAVRLHWNRREYSTAADVRSILLKAAGKIVDAVRIGAWVRRHDVVVMAGMGAFETTLPLRPWGTPYSQFLLCALGRRFGTRVALVSVGANVESRRAIRWLFVGAARRVHYLSYRDEYSRASMREMGLVERGDAVYPDLVYSLPTPPVPEGPTGVVGVGVLDYHGGNDDRHRAQELHESYVAGFRKIVRHLLDGGQEVRLLTGADVDETVVAEILADVEGYAPGRVHADPVTSLEELMRQMAGCDTVVATRFHNVLCALKLARPTVSVGYARKNVELMVDMGLEAYCHRADGFDADEVCRQLAELGERRVELNRSMAARAEEHRRALDTQFAALDAALFAGG